MDSRVVDKAVDAVRKKLGIGSRPVVPYDIPQSINEPFQKELEACGEKVILKKLEYNHEQKFGEIVLPDTRSGSKMTKAEVISVGRDAKLTGLKPGQIVLYDTYSVFFDTYPIVITKFENIIGVLEE